MMGPKTPAMPGRPADEGAEAMKKDMKKRRKKTAAPPGTIHYTGERTGDTIKIRLLGYGEESFEEKTAHGAEECLEFRQRHAMTWIDIAGVHDVDFLEKLGANFKIHPLILEDIAHVEQRPKMEDHDDYCYFVIRMLTPGGPGDYLGEQVSLILGKDYVISFQEREGDVFGPVRDHSKTTRWRTRKLGPDYLVYALMDAVVDNYFVILEHLEETVEALEESIGTNPAKESLSEIHRLKRGVIYLRKTVWPLREVINAFQRSQSDLIQRATNIYIKDLYDHTVQVLDSVESLRDVLSGIQDLYHTTIANHMNEVMKVLTVIATIFIPPTFIAGVYGMNFEFMPELKWPWGYAFVWGLIAASMFGMTQFFRSKKWF